METNYVQGIDAIVEYSFNHKDDWDDELDWDIVDSFAAFEVKYNPDTDKIIAIQLQGST